jgi:hypothetical protein
MHRRGNRSFQPTRVVVRTCTSFPKPNRGANARRVKLQCQGSFSVDLFTRRDVRLGLPVSKEKLPLPIGEGIGELNAVCNDENDVASIDKELFRWRAFFWGYRRRC